MALQTLSQRRAHHAWKVVDAHLSRSGIEDFAREAKKLPMRILTSGLGQSLAFAKKKSPELVDALTSWMQEYQRDDRIVDLLERVVKGDSDFQRLATAECLAYLAWLVRFADAPRKE